MQSVKSSTAAPIPPLQATDATPCYDPGVDRDAIVALANTRVALASCRKKQQNVVSQYNDVRETFGEPQ